MIRFIILVFLIFLFSTEDAGAYIDPSTGSYVSQILIAALLAGLFAAKLFWRRIIDYFKKIFSKKARH